jgi:sec-independent protein translocase protein TatC
MLAVPMWLLFEIGLLFGRFVQKRERPLSDEDASPDAQPPAERP